MAVTESVTLGDQPSAGTIVYQPLAGDGWSSPHSMYVLNIPIAQDASGGVIAIRVSRDPRWEHLAGVMGFLNTNTTAAAVQFDITSQDAVGPFFMVGAVPGLLPGGTQAGVWVPPPIINPQTMNVRAANVDTFTLTMTGLIYNFRHSASLRVPLAVLLASIPTGGSFQTS